MPALPEQQRQHEQPARHRLAKQEQDGGRRPRPEHHAHYDHLPDASLSPRPASLASPLMAAVPAQTLDTPDIIVIQHESIFDPRLFGLPVEPGVEALLEPQGGRHGRLRPRLGSAQS